MSKNSDKKILKSIKSLREDLASRLDDIEARLGRLESEIAPQGDEARLDLPDVDEETASDLTDVSVQPTRVPAEVASVLPGGVTGTSELATFKVIIKPLQDLGQARLVEEALATTEGVDRAKLSSISGDSAAIEVIADEDASIIGALRSQLSVAFDVTETESDSVTIALAQPPVRSDGGVAASGRK